MSDEPTAAEVDALADLIHVRESRLAIAHNILTSDWYAERIAEARHEGAVGALEKAAGEVPWDEYEAKRRDVSGWLNYRAAALRDTP